MKKQNLHLLAVPVYLLAGLAFIWQTSFTAIDGQRYFSLTDDAMISMC